MDKLPSIPNITKVAVLAFPGCMGAELFSFRDMFEIANALAARLNKPRVQIKIVTVREGSIALSNGNKIECDRIGKTDFDLLVIPGFMFLDVADVTTKAIELQPELDFIRRIAAHKITFASICVGAFLLAWTGLLNNRRATTGWLLAAQMENCHPEILLEKTAILVEDGNIITAGAFSASADLAHHLIKKLHGTEVALQTHSVTLVDGTRASQSPFIRRDLIIAPSSEFAATVDRWLLANLRNRYSLVELAAALATSPRTLMRKYKKATGSTPLIFLQTQRIEKAKQLLLTSTATISQIALDVGYEDVNGFRKIFLRETELSPSIFREKFWTSYAASE